MGTAYGGSMRIQNEHFLIDAHLILIQPWPHRMPSGVSPIMNPSLSRDESGYN